jgi:hypothetical protein
MFPVKRTKTIGIYVYFILNISVLLCYCGGTQQFRLAVTLHS